MEPKQTVKIVAPTPTTGEIRDLEMDRLYDAIMAKDREGALDALRHVFPRHSFRSVREQRNLFPDRVPA